MTTTGKPNPKARKKEPQTDPWSLDDFLADYRPLERIVPITTRGDLVGRLMDLEADLEAARDESGSGGLGDANNVIKIAEEIAKLREEVRASSRNFRLVSVGDRVWSDIIAKHPPDDEEKSQGLPWHVESFYRDALAASIAEPQMSPEQADKLLDVISAGQVRKLVGAMFEVNGGGDDLPKSEASFVLQNASKPKRTTASRGESLGLDSLGEL